MVMHLRNFKDRLRVFREWLKHGQKYDMVEAHLKLTKEKEVKGKKKRECLTIKEMVERGFSECHASIS